MRGEVVMLCLGVYLVSEMQTPRTSFPHRRRYLSFLTTSLLSISSRRSMFLPPFLKQGRLLNSVGRCSLFLNRCSLHPECKLTTHRVECVYSTWKKGASFFLTPHAQVLFLRPNPLLQRIGWAFFFPAKTCSKEMDE